MNTAETTVADLLAVEGQAFNAKRDAWASVVFARTAEELDRATSQYRKAVITHAKARDAWYYAAKTANLLR